MGKEEILLIILLLYSGCQTAYCGRHKLHFDFAALSLRLHSLVLELTVGSGNARLTRFINVKDGNVSEKFNQVVTYNSDKVVYPAYRDGAMKIIVQDIFDKNKFYLEVIRDYAPVAVGRYMIIDAEFLDDTTLCLEYYRGEEDIDGLVMRTQEESERTNNAARELA